MLTAYVCCGGFVSFRNQRLCWVKKRKIQFRFPWRAASLLRPQKHMTPGEYTQLNDDRSGKIMRKTFHLPVCLYVLYYTIYYCLVLSCPVLSCVVLGDGDGFQVHPVQLTCRPKWPPHLIPDLLLALLLLFLLSLSLLLRCDPSDINISDEMSKTTVWKSLNSNQKDTRPVAAKKARPYIPFIFPHPCHLKIFPATHCDHLLLSNCCSNR